MKTLGQCVKTKPATVVEPAPPIKPLVANAEPWNAFLLTNPRFALTIDELHAVIATDFTSNGLEFDTHFLPDGDVVIRASSTGSWLQKLNVTLAALKPAISTKIENAKLASSTLLCAVDTNMNVLRKEEVGATTGSGWSQVAKGGNGVRKVVDTTVGQKSSFTVLGSKLKKENELKAKAKEKAVKQEEAPDDWEREVEAWGDA
jgi:transcriptional repressor NF-X1